MTNYFPITEDISSCRSTGYYFSGDRFTLLLISFTIVPVFGLFIAIPALVLAVAFPAAKRSKACKLYRNLQETCCQSQNPARESRNG